jgi:hypothetical protein
MKCNFIFQAYRTYGFYRTYGAIALAPFGNNRKKQGQDFSPPSCASLRKPGLGGMAAQTSSNDPETDILGGG